MGRREGQGFFFCPLQRGGGNESGSFFLLGPKTGRETVNSLQNLPQGLLDGVDD